MTVRVGASDDLVSLAFRFTVWKDLVGFGFYAVIEKVVL
jgi:hypothetical protein